MSSRLERSAIRRAPSTRPAHGISEGLCQAGDTRPPRNHRDENSDESGHQILAHDVPLRQVPFAALLSVTRCEGCSQRTNTEATGLRPGSFWSLGWRARVAAQTLMKGSRCTMSNKENEKFDDKPSSTENPGDVVREDPLADTSRLLSQEVPPGVDRRSFLIRSAVGGAAAVMTGRVVSADARMAMAIATMPSVAARQGRRRRCSADLDVVKKGQGPVLTIGRRVLQGGPGAFELAHDRSDAHHLRFLPASHETAGRQTRHGDEASGELVRKPQRDRQGTRHGTSRARRTGRERAGDGRPEVPGRLARQAGPDVPGEARRQVDRCEPQGHHLRCSQGRLQAPEHDDVQAPRRQRGAARAGVLLRGRWIHRVERVTRPRRRTRRSIRSGR